MRWILGILVVLASAVAAALLLMFNHGNLAIFWPPYRVDLSINTAVVLLIAIVVLMFLASKAFVQLISLPARVRSHREHRYRERALAAFREATVALAEGRFARAEKQSQLALHLPEQGGAAALVAARACHGLRALDRRDQWIERCAQEFGLKDQAQLLAADCAIQDRDGAAALAALDRLQPRTARQVHALRLRLAALELEQQWQALLPVLSQLERRQMVAAPAVAALRLRAWRNLLNQTGTDLAATKSLWRQIARELAYESPIAESAIEAFRRAADFSAAADIAERVLRKRFSGTVIDQYAGLDALSGREKLHNMEQWLQRWGPEPALLAALGRVCSEQQLWGKAEAYLRESMAKDDSPGTRLALARLLEQTERSEEATGLYREAAQTQRPPSTSRQAPVINAASSEAR
ncbi:MAG: heme biosynthesis HemY N-terminal domain-containing protein [Betaproteobacteria bacterium]